VAARSRQDAERLAVSYLTALRRVADRDHWAEVNRLPLGGTAKVGANAYAMENGCVILTYKGGTPSDFWKGEQTTYVALKEKLRPREYDHLVVLYPSMTEDDALLEAVAAERCRRALSTLAWSASMAAGLKDLREVRGKIAKLFETNPWLEKSLTATSAALGSVEERLAKLAAQEGQSERDEIFEAAEDDVERAERFRVEDAADRASRINEHTVELFVKEFLKTYRKQVESAGLERGAEPPLYLAYPYKIEAHLLSNKSCLITVRHATEAPGFATVSSDFSRAKSLLENPAGAFVFAFDNDARYESSEARFLAEKAAASDAASAKAAGTAKALAADIDAAEKDISAAGRTNPWLQASASKLVEALSRARVALEKVASDYSERVERGAVVRTELVRSNLELVPHGARAMLVPPAPSVRRDAPASRTTSTPPPDRSVRDLTEAEAPSASASGASATRGAAPTVTNVPETPDHVFQEVDYYNFPQSKSVRSAEAVTRPAPRPPPREPEEPAAGVDLEVRAKAAELETRINDYERRLFYLDKYVEMIQKQQLDKTKLLRDLIRVEGKRSRSRGVGIAVFAALLATLALIPVWPQTLAAIRAFFAAFGLAI
jgi:hypothetical protein